MKIIKTYRLFFGSLAFGVLLWLITFFFLPVEVTEDIKPKTILFIVSCYLSSVLGFILFKFKTSTVNTSTHNTSFFKFLTLFLLFCFVLRWIDLFFLREISLSNDAITNRNQSAFHSHKSNIIFVIASLFKSLYFFPFVIALKSKYRFNFYTILVMLLLLFPLVEGLLFGSRKPFFEVFLILIISIFYYKKPNINLKSIIVVLISAIGLLVISASILFSREESKEGSVDVRNEIINGKYNDLLKPNDQVLNYFEDESISSAQKDYALIILQSSQYITHGVFEYNHIIDMPDLAVTKGMYTFYPFRKFFNKLGFITEFENVNPSPRKFVYLTAFGSLYIDFRWFTLLFFFLFGMFQRYVYDKSFSSSIHSPILIYLTIINVFLPILNYMRGAGIYPIVGFLFVLITHYYFLKISNEKSTNT